MIAKYANALKTAAAARRALRVLTVIPGVRGAYQRRHQVATTNLGKPATLPAAGGGSLNPAPAPPPTPT